ncbi:MAG: hypothetical protein U0Q15_00780 [Kineosporiaceae bacterium]
MSTSSPADPARRAVKAVPVAPVAPVAPAPERLVREWIACGLVAAAARFVPVPLLDDAVAGRATRIAIARTLRHHGRDYSVDDVEPLAAGPDGWLPGVARYVRAVPGKLLLFPLRKYQRVITAARGVPDDVTTVLLLAHVTHVRLAEGGLNGATAQERRQEANELRKAFDRVHDEMDWAVLRTTGGETLSGLKGLPQAALRFGRSLLSRAPEQDDAAPPEADAQVDEAVTRVRGLLQRPEVAALLAEFDARMARATRR